MTAEDNIPDSADTVVLIHGLWMTPRSWEYWIERYRSAGFRVFAPAWPGLEAEVEELRRDPTPLAGLGATRVLGHYERIIRKLESPPIIMGHSFGGAFVQVLLDRGLGSAGVAIDSANIRGVYRLPVSTLRSAFPVLQNPANIRRAVPLTPEQFHYAFANTLNAAESQLAYDRYCVPAAGRLLFEGAAANLNPRTPLRVNFQNSTRAPLLFIAGGTDHVAPPAINRENLSRYRKSASLTDYLEFAGRSHYTLGQPGWEQVADQALQWAITQRLRVSRPEPRDESSRNDWVR
jgi:pimeloyl-ACP methyl ester carboxylesterase